MYVKTIGRGYVSGSGPSARPRMNRFLRLGITPVLLLCGMAKAQDVPAPFVAAAPLAGINWQLNGFTQIRFTSPAQDRLSLSLGQFSLTASPAADKGTQFFLQAGVSTIGAPDVFLLEAWVAREFASGFRVQAGRFLVPFSRQFMTAPSNLLFPDISTADAAFNAPYAWGSTLSMTRKRLAWFAAAITNPTPVDSLGRTAPAGHPGAVGRVDFNLLQPFGYLETAPTDPEKLQLSVGVAGLYSRSAFESPVQNVMPGDRTVNFTADGGLRHRRLAIQAAVYRRSVWTRQAGTYDDWAGYAQAGYYLLPHRLEAAVRLGKLEFGHWNCVDSPRRSRERSAGLNWYFRSHFLKVQADYTWRRIEPFDAAPERDGQFRLQTQFAF